MSDTREKQIVPMDGEYCRCSPICHIFMWQHLITYLSIYHYNSCQLLKGTIFYTSLLGREKVLQRHWEKVTLRKAPLKEKHMKRRTAKSTIKSVFIVALLEKVWQLFTPRENITVVLLFVTSYQC